MSDTCGGCKIKRSSVVESGLAASLFDFALLAAPLQHEPTCRLRQPRNVQRCSLQVQGAGTREDQLFRVLTRLFSEDVFLDFLRL